MPTDASFWANVGVLLGALVAIIGGYRSWSKAQAAKGTEHAVIAGFGMGCGNKEMVEQLTRIADACEAVADQKQTEMQETMENLLKRLDESEQRGR